MENSCAARFTDGSNGDLEIAGEPCQIRLSGNLCVSQLWLKLTGSTRIREGEGGGGTMKPDVSGKYLSPMNLVKGKALSQ